MSITYPELDPKNALVYTWFDSQFDFQGKRVCANLARHPLAPRVLTMGDGTTANTIPSQLVGRHGIALGGTQYVDTGLIDPFERTDRFTLVASISGTTSTDSHIISTMDQAQTSKGASINIRSATVFAGELVNTTGNLIRLITSGSNLRQVNTLIFTYNGTSLASGSALYINGALSNATVSVDALSASIKSGKSLLLGCRHNGASKSTFLAGNMHFAAAYLNIEATPQQVQYLNRLALTRVNQP